MPYKVQKNGRNYDVIIVDTGEVKATHKPPDAKKKADAQVRLLEDQEGFDNPDKTMKTADGKKVNVIFKNKGSYDGPLA